MKIAIIGSGISGLGAAHLLHDKHEITLFEKNATLGGHSRTVNAKVDGIDIPIDTGFIVFNKRNYPNLVSLFNQLGVPIAKSDMSFGVSVNNAWLEYGTRRPLDIFSQKMNLLRPQFWQMLRDIFKFNKQAKKYLTSDITLGKCLDELGLGNWFKAYYLLPMGASIWSMPIHEMLAFPAQSFIRFFDNHGLLTINDQPQWYTVKGGSQEYIKLLTAPFADNIKRNCGIKKVIRHNNHIELLDASGIKTTYDQVIFACHTDQILNILAQPTKAEQQIIGAIDYQTNEMVLHSDTSFMPKRQSAWSSWVYLSDTKEDQTSSISLSYWMNNLQPLATKKPMLVTLNPGREPDAAKVYDRYTFHHPVFDKKAIDAQGCLEKIQGVDRIWYAGAWQGYGFHEDGLLSAVKIAKKLGAHIPWK
jgi:predicted NAD/FAD-binding protein